MGQGPGELGDYTLDRVVASATGEASFEATHQVLPRRALVTIATTQASGGRVVREACVLESLRHPGVPRAYDCGVTSGQPWIATELVEGERFTAPIAASELVALIRDVAAVLAHAHARGVIHGDIWLDAIVKDDGTRGFPLCLVHWRSAKRAASGEGDVYALGLLAFAALPDRVPSRLGALVDDMLAADRPGAAEISARAAALAEAQGFDDPDAEEVALVVDLSRPPGFETDPGLVPQLLAVGRKAEIDAAVARIGPARRDGLRPRVEVHAVAAVDVVIAEQRRLPAAERVVRHRHGESAR